MKTFEVYNLGNLPTAPLDAFHDLQEDFKKSDPEKLSKLQILIITRGFKYAFKAWKDKDGKLWIIDAHQRKKALLALRKVGFAIPEIPYEPIFAESKKEAVEEIAAYNSEFATKNPDTLLFKKYNIDTDTLSTFNLGFSPVALEPISFDSEGSFNNSETCDIEEDSDSDVEIEEDAPSFSAPGDVWLLGDHRLMCGDCRNSADVARLMNGASADLCVTDPPYNVAYQGSTEEQMTIDNDSMENDLFKVFLSQVFKSMNECMKPGAAIYVFHADGEGISFRQAFNENFKFAQCCIWVKNSFTLGRQDYQHQFEPVLYGFKHGPILYGWKKGAAHNWNADRKQTTVWNFDKPTRNNLHPTTKPIALMAYPIRNSSAPGQLVIDFFSGSGSTLMACQQVDRLCCAMEIDPKYIDRSVLRFKTMFSKQPIRLLRGNVELSIEETAKIMKNERPC